MDTQTQIDRLIELAIIQRTELKQLVEQLPQLREHLNAEVEKVFEETEPQLRSELEEWTTKQTADKTAALGVALEAKIANLAKSLEISTQARYSAIIAEREENARLAAQAEAKIAEAAAALPSQVKEIVTAELARFPRAGEIDQLRKEFAEPRGLNPRGKWKAGETYNRLDLVTYNGDSFVSNIDGNTEKPSRNAANWTLNAARGAYGGGGGITSLNDVLNAPTSGQIIGSQNGQYVPKTLVAGANITINETASSITIIGDEGQISLQDGTAAAPSLFFTNDTDTGLYRPAANTLGVAVGGAQVAYFDANGITTVGAGATFDGSVHAANGNANNPSLSFTSDDNTGFFRHQPDEIGITLGGTQTGTLTSALATLTSKLLVSSGATTTAATDLLVNPAVKASGNLLDLQVASSSKFSVSSAGNGTFGGNLTVSGTAGTIGSNSGFTWDLGSGINFIALSTGRPTITAAVASGNNAGAALSLLPRGGGSRRTWNLETDTTEAGDCVLRQSTTEAGSTFTNALYFSAARNATLSGNLTVNGAINAFGQSVIVSPSSGTAKGRINADPFRADVIQVGSNWTGGAQDDATKPSWYWFFDSRVSGDAATLYRVPAGGSSTSALAISSTAATFSGNLTVSGTGVNTFNVGAGTSVVSLNSTAATPTWISMTSGATTLGSIARTGNDLVISGGNSGAALTLTYGATQTATITGNLTVSGGTISSGTASLTLKSTASTVVLQSAGTTALTLDSGQNATFAGTVTATGSVSTSKAVVGGSVLLSARNTDNTNSVSAAVAQLTVGGSSAGDPRLLFTIDAVQDWSVGVDNSDGDKFKIGPSSAVGTSTSLTLDPTTGNATFAGAIAIGNTVQTAAAVASTHKVTVVIGGSTYYLLATNV